MTAQLRLVLTVAAALVTGTASAQVARPARDIPAGGQPAQAQAAGTGVISGTVTMGGTGQPARKVRVSLSGAEIRGSRAATTDDQGRFSFTALPAGRYGLTASRPGHITVTYGQVRPGRPGTQIQLSDGQSFRADLQIPKASVITGTVLDENGEPSPQVQVRAFRVTTQNGERTVVGNSGSSTDDRGIYRMFGLMPGDYLVCATPRNTTISDIERARTELQALRQALPDVARRPEGEVRGIRDRIAGLQASIAASGDDPAPAGYAPICYPGAVSTANAGVVTVGVAEERTAVDFQLQLAAMARVEGTVLNTTGTPLGEVQIRLIPANQLGSELGSSSARADAEGRFRLPNVAPGHYRLTARAIVRPVRGAAPGEAPAGGRGRGAQGPGAEPISLWAAADVLVDGRDVSNVMLTLQQGVSVSGQVRFDGAATPPPDLTRLRVTMAPSDPGPFGGAAAGRVDANGRFTIASVTPGRYRLTAAGASGWLVESALIGGQDALDIPIDVKGNQNLGGALITFTDRTTELTGTIVDGGNQPALDYTLVIFPSDQRFWARNARRIQTARPATDGRFVFRNLPPGDYLMAPVVDVETGGAFDPAFLQPLEASALRITLHPGDRKVQDLRVSR